MEMVMRAHLASASLHRKGFQSLSKLADRMIRLVFSAIIPSEADIHRTVKFFHNGFGVAITKETRIAEHCQIGSGVVFASRWPVAGGRRSYPGKRRDRLRECGFGRARENSGGQRDRRELPGYHQRSSAVSRGREPCESL